MKRIKKVKTYWLINTKGKVCEAPVWGLKAPDRKKYGNYFKSKKIAETARVRIIKLFKRLNKNK